MWYTSIKILIYIQINIFKKRERKSKNVSEQRNPTFENPFFFAKHVTTLEKLYTPSNHYYYLYYNHTKLTEDFLTGGQSVM
jgi:hypothetical protein